LVAFRWVFNQTMHTVTEEELSVVFVRFRAPI
jgi:hypothetical protein